MKEEKNTFSKTFLKHLEGKNSEKTVKNNISYLNKKTTNQVSDDNSKRFFEKINTEICSFTLKDEFIHFYGNHEQLLEKHAKIT